MIINQAVGVPKGDVDYIRCCTVLDVPIGVFSGYCESAELQEDGHCYLTVYTEDFECLTIRVTPPFEFLKMVLEPAFITIVKDEKCQVSVTVTPCNQMEG